MFVNICAYRYMHLYVFIFVYAKKMALSIVSKLLAVAFSQEWFEVGEEEGKILM